MSTSERLSRIALELREPAALLAELNKGAPASAAPPAGAESAVEAMLLRLWAELLRVKVTRDTDFFDAGGDSLLGVELVVRAEQLGYRLSLAKVIELGVLSEVAKSAVALKGQIPEPAPAPPSASAASGPQAGELPLSHGQRAMFEAMEGVDEYAIHDCFEIAPGITAEHGQRAVEALGRAFEALRLQLLPAEGLQRSRGAEPDPRAFHRVDLSGLPEAEQDREMQDHLPALSRELALSRGLMQRMVWFDLGPARRARLLAGYQAFMVDGLSQWLLAGHLAQALEDVAAGRAPVFPQGSSYSSWVEACVAYARSPRAREDAGRWRAALEGSDGALPQDFPGRNTKRSSERFAFSVPVGRQTDAQALLLSAIGEGLPAWTGRARSRVLTVAAGRTDPTGLELSGTVGKVSSYFPVVVGGASPEQVRARLALLPHHTSFGMVRYLSPEDEVRRQLAPFGSADLAVTFERGSALSTRLERPALTSVPGGAGLYYPPEAIRPSKVLVRARHGADGVLSGLVSYSSQLYRPEPVKAFVAELTRALERGA